MWNCEPQGGVKFDPRAITWRNLIETHQVKLHAKFGSSRPYGFWQEDFQRFKKKLSFVAMATRVFEGIKFFQKILKRTMAGTFLWNFIKIQQAVSEKKMIKEKVNARTDGRTDGRTNRCTVDNRPWHKLAGLWPVELKTHPPDMKEILQKGRSALHLWYMFTCTYTHPKWTWSLRRYIR